MKRAVYGLVVTLLLTSMLALAFYIQPVKASGTIYIRADGSIDPATAPISTTDNVTYTFTSDIYDQIILVQRSNIVINGNGYTLQGTGSRIGIALSERTNVTIRNMTIKAFTYGIGLSSSNNSNVSDDNIANNMDGIWLDYSSNNSVNGNNITNNQDGIDLFSSDNNSVNGNNITANQGVGIALAYSYNNSVSGNNVANNGNGIWLDYSYNNRIYHNNFINNTDLYSYDSTNVWDDGYPSGGNYWSDYTATDTEKGPYQNITGPDGIGDTAYVIDANNNDSYPLSPSTQPSHDIGILDGEQWKKVVFQGFPLCTYGSMINYGNNTEDVSTIAYANGIAFDSKNSTLQSKTWNTTGFTFASSFGWNTASLAKSVNYSLSFYAYPVQGETDTADNNFTDGWVVVSMVGDLTGGTSNPWDFVPDGKVDGKDITIVALCFGSAPGCPPPYIWNANSDVNNDGKVDGKDIALVAAHFGQAAQ